MVGNENIEVVTIGQERFEELLNNEVRTDMVCNMLTRKDLPIEEVLSMLGKDYLVAVYQARKKRERAELDEYWRRRKEEQKSEGE